MLGTALGEYSRVVETEQETAMCFVNSHVLFPSRVTSAHVLINRERMTHEYEVQSSITQQIWSFSFNIVMASNADQVLGKLGSFGRYQLLLIICANFLVWCWYAWPSVLNTFITAEPGWRCVQNGNNSEWRMNGTVYPGDDTFDHRCDISKEAWEFVDDYTSVVTEVTTREYS